MGGQRCGSNAYLSLTTTHWLVARSRQFFGEVQSCDTLSHFVQQGLVVYKILGFAALLTIACTSRESTKEELCEQLRDHVVDLRAETLAAPTRELRHGSSAGADPNSERSEARPDVEGHKAALKRALGTEYVDYCVKSISPGQLRCSLAVTNAADVTTCQTH